MHYIGSREKWNQEFDEPICNYEQYLLKKGGMRYA